MGLNQSDFSETAVRMDNGLLLSALLLNYCDLPEGPDRPSNSSAKTNGRLVVMFFSQEQMAKLAARAGPVKLEADRDAQGAYRLPDMLSQLQVAHRPMHYRVDAHCARAVHAPQESPVL
jgi:hypothetical protein